jgi:hypothetical protein
MTKTKLPPALVLLSYECGAVHRRRQGLDAPLLDLQKSPDCTENEAKVTSAFQKITADLPRITRHRRPSSVGLRHYLGD